jgi:hypothetical protein
MNDCWVDVDLRRYHAGKPSEFGERIEVLVRIPEQVAKKLAGPGREPAMDIDAVWQRASDVATKTVGIPNPPLAIDVRNQNGSTMPPDLPETSNYQDEDGAEGWILKRKPSRSLKATVTTAPLSPQEKKRRR